MLKKFVTTLALVLSLVGTTQAAHPTTYNLGVAGVTTGSWYPRGEQVIWFLVNSDGSVFVAGTISPGAGNASSLYFSTSQANGIVYTGYMNFTVPDGPNSTFVNWSVTIPAEVGFAGGDKIGDCYLYDVNDAIIGATGAWVPSMWVASPAVLAASGK